MALAAELQTVVDDLSKFLEDPADAGTLKALFEKNAKLAQEVKDGRLRQSDYDRFLNENKQRLKYADDMKKWADTNVPKHEKLTKDFADLEALNRDLETKVTDYRDQLAKAAAGGDVDEATLSARIETRVKELGYVPKAEMEAIIRQEAGKLADEKVKTEVEARTNTFLTQTWPAVQAINQAVIMKSFSHMKEFGEPLNDDDVTAISKIMTERNLQDPRKAYDIWIEPKRTAKTIEAEVEKRVQAKLSESAGFPGVSGQPMMELGPVQLKHAGKIPELPEGTKLGDNAAAMAAAAELRSESKF
jgi:hypothetical protein